MIKEYRIIYEQFDWYEGYVTNTTKKNIVIPAPSLFEAVDYCHNILQITNITEVCEV